MFHAMIMAGGGGTRFWPQSRRGRPKQFLRLAGEGTLLQDTFGRIEPLVPAERAWVVTADRHVGLTREQLPALEGSRVVGEPTGRDTAAAIGLGAALIAREDADAVMMVTPADHVIEPAQLFRDAAHAAAGLAEEHPEALITFGIPPTEPSVNFGYIHRGGAIAGRQGLDAFRVQGFREKPNRDLAEEYLATGEYFWNSGIFVWKVRAILGELKRQRPQLMAAVARIVEAWDAPNRDEVFRAEYEALEKISIDYAVMENAGEVLVVQAPYQWDDVGSWLALERRNPQDAHGNTVRGLHCGLHTNDCVIVSGGGDDLITTIGVSDLLIVRDGDATLIADRRDEAAVKQLVEKLKQSGLGRYL